MLLAANSRLGETGLRSNALARGSFCCPTAPSDTVSTPFDDPVPLPDGRQLVTLKQAAAYIQKLPRATQEREEWQTAVRCLIGAAEGRHFLMHARIGMVRALCLTQETTAILATQPALAEPFPVRKRRPKPGSGENDPEGAAFGTR
jgi:hypothetical protein